MQLYAKKKKKTCVTTKYEQEKGKTCVQLCILRCAQGINKTNAFEKHVE